MRRLAGILLVAIVAAVTPLAADLTITTVTTIVVTSARGTGSAITLSSSARDTE